MRGYDLLKRLEELPEEKRHYAVQYFMGAVSMAADGFTEPHPDQTNANWALDRMEQAIVESEKQP